MWNLKYDTNEPTYKTETDSQTQRTDKRLPRVGGGISWGYGVSGCKLLYIEWINNKVLLYRAENYIQYPVINHNGKECNKECIYIITESLCYTAEANTTL